MIPSNYHTHTRFCDGKNTPEEIVREAIRLGCPELGFPVIPIRFSMKATVCPRPGHRRI